MSFVLEPGDHVYYWQIDKSKIKHGTTSWRWYKARIVSQEGAVCAIDTGSTVLWVTQSKLRKENMRTRWLIFENQISAPQQPLPCRVSGQMFLTIVHRSILLLQFTG